VVKTPINAASTRLASYRSVLGSNRPDHIIIRIADFQKSPALDEAVTDQQTSDAIDACPSGKDTTRISPVARDAGRVDNC
jgi:hypothetical protein